MSNFGPSVTSEFQAAEKPPKPDANGLFGPLDINSCFFKYTNFNNLKKYVVSRVHI